MSGLSKVTTNVGTAGIGLRPLNKDKISGILFFNNTLPSGFTTTTRVKKVFSLAQAETLGLASGSADSAVEWYHVSEYFRANPDGELWIGYFAVPASTYDFTEITTMQTLSSGEIRQLGVYANALTFAAAQCTTIQAIWAALDEPYKQVSILYAANFSAITAITGWATVTDLRTLTARKVSVIIAEDGGGAGAVLAAAKSYSITALGAILGNVSKASVQQSIGNPANFNVSNGTELEVPALANGDLISSMTLTALGSLKDKGYTIIRKYIPDIAGSYPERVPTAVASTNDFAWIETNRTVDKAIRLVRAALIPQLQATLYLKSDGTLREDTQGYFTDLAQKPLTQMQADGEISASQVIIDPTQNVLSTSTLTLTVKIIPVGIAEQIVVNIGLTTSL
jgi:hypothetical protein